MQTMVLHQGRLFRGRVVSSNESLLRNHALQVYQIISRKKVRSVGQLGVLPFTKVAYKHVDITLPQ